MSKHARFEKPRSKRHPHYAGVFNAPPRADGEEVVRIISARKAAPGKGGCMRRVTKKQAKELAALARMRDEDKVKDWSRAVVGKFYRPIKRPVTIRVDADVLAWLKRQGRGYQTRINKLLPDAMEGPAEGKQRRKLWRSA
jgi:uncharacterized protein (DUF4415 family)